MRTIGVWLVLPVVISALALGCDEDVPAQALPADGGTGSPSVLRFEARIGSELFSCSRAYQGLGKTKVAIEPLDFRLYVHDVRLVSEDGSEVPFVLTPDGKWQTRDVALLDFEDRTGTCVNGNADLNGELRGVAPPGKYKGVKLRLGVPFSLNHADVASAAPPLNVSSLFWSWNGGYKFARVDARVKGLAGMDGGTGGMGDGGMGGMDGGMDHGGEANVFNIHLGSTMCAGEPAQGSPITSCGRPNRGEILLTGFDPLAKAIVIDLAALTADSDLSRNGGGAPGCMSGDDDPECPSILERLGVDPSTGEANAARQTFFRAP